MSNPKFEAMWSLLLDGLLKLDHLITDDLICVLCKKILINAQQAPCGCKFCIKCIENYIEEGNTFCPGAREECSEEALSKHSSISIDHRTNNIISKLKVKCLNTTCPIEIELKNMDEHLQVCEFTPKAILNETNPEKLSNDVKLVNMITNLMNAVSTLQEQREKDRDEINALKEHIAKISIEQTSSVSETQSNLQEKIRQKENDISHLVRENEAMKAAYSDRFRSEMRTYLDQQISDFAIQMATLYETQLRDHTRRMFSDRGGDETVSVVNRVTSTAGSS